MSNIKITVDTSELEKAKEILIDIKEIVDYLKELGITRRRLKKAITYNIKNKLTPRSANIIRYQRKAIKKQMKKGKTLGEAAKEVGVEFSYNTPVSAANENETNKEEFFKSVVTYEEHEKIHQYKK